MSDSTDIDGILCAIPSERCVISTPQIYYLSTLDARILHLAYFWLLVIAASVDTITFGLFCVKVYLSWEDSITTPILSALFTQ